MSETHSSRISRLNLVHADMSDAEGLAAVIRRLSTAKALQEIMEVVTQAARALLAADGVTFVLRDGDWCHYAEEDAISPLWRGKRFPLDACISGWCMKEGESAVIPDIYEDVRIPQDAYRPTFVRSLAMVPVRQDEPLAAIGAYWATPREPSTREMRILQTVANATALTFANLELKEERDKRRMLSGELKHRLGNTLAVVQAIVRQVLRDSPEEAGTINERIAALNTTNEILAGEERQSRSIQAIMSQELQPYGDSRIDIEGDELSLGPLGVQALSLVIHELATNAAKYGALSVDDGHLRVRWNVAEEGATAAIHWVETVSVASPPAGTGFGLHFIRRVLAEAGGTFATKMLPSGFSCDIALPLREARS